MCSQKVSKYKVDFGRIEVDHLLSCLMLGVNWARRHRAMVWKMSHDQRPPQVLS